MSLMTGNLKICGKRSDCRRSVDYIIEKNGDFYMSPEDLKALGRDSFANIKLKDLLGKDKIETARETLYPQEDKKTSTTAIIEKCIEKGQTTWEKWDNCLNDVFTKFPDPTLCPLINETLDKHAVKKIFGNGLADCYDYYSRSRKVPDGYAEYIKLEILTDCEEGYQESDLSGDNCVMDEVRNDGIFLVNYTRGSDPNAVTPRIETKFCTIFKNPDFINECKTTKLTNASYRNWHYSDCPNFKIDYNKNLCFDNVPYSQLPWISILLVLLTLASLAARITLKEKLDNLGKALLNAGFLSLALATVANKIKLLYVLNLYNLIPSNIKLLSGRFCGSNYSGLGVQTPLDQMLNLAPNIVVFFLLAYLMRNKKWWHYGIAVFILFLLMYGNLRLLGTIAYGCSL